MTMTDDQKKNENSADHHRQHMLKSYVLVGTGSEAHDFWET